MVTNLPPPTFQGAPQVAAGNNGDCTFEVDECGWTNPGPRERADEIDWVRTVAADNRAPSRDHTIGTTQGRPITRSAWDCKRTCGHVGCWVFSCCCFLVCQILYRNSQLLERLKASVYLCFTSLTSLAVCDMFHISPVLDVLIEYLVVHNFCFSFVYCIYFVQLSISMRELYTRMYLHESPPEYIYFMPNIPQHLCPHHKHSLQISWSLSPYDFPMRS